MAEQKTPQQKMHAATVGGYHSARSLEASVPQDTTPGRFRDKDELAKFLDEQCRGCPAERGCSYRSIFFRNLEACDEGRQCNLYFKWCKDVTRVTAAENENYGQVVCNLRTILEKP